MRILLFISCLMLIEAGVVKEDCDGVVISGLYYDKEVLKSDIDRPYLLAVDYSTNTVYFSYNTENDDESYKTTYINLNTKKTGDVPGVTNGFAQTVDQKNHDIYIGGSNGIYKYNHKSKQAEFIGAKNANVWIIYFKDILYYADFPKQFLYTFIDGVSTRFQDLEDTKVDQFVIDNEDTLFYTNASGLFGQMKGTKDAVQYKNNQTVRSLTSDVNGDVYVCEIDDIFKINKEKQSLDKVMDVDDCFGLAFDNENNIIYSDATKLVRLVPNFMKDC